MEMPLPRKAASWASSSSLEGGGLVSEGCGKGRGVLTLQSRAARVPWKLLAAYH